jgi:hypothetical protein
LNFHLFYDSFKKEESDEKIKELGTVLLFNILRKKVKEQEHQDKFINLIKTKISTIYDK